MADSSIIENIFEQEPVLDQRVRKYEINRYTTNQPFSTTANASEITIDTLAGSLDSFSYLPQSSIGVSFAFRSAGATDIVTPLKAHIIQNGWSLFSRAVLKINDSTVENVENCGLVAHVKKLTESTRDQIAGQGAASAYYPNDYDVSAALSNTDNALSADVIVAKATKRFRPAATTHYLNLPLRDIFGFAACKKVIPGARIKVVLTPETSFQKVIMASSGSDAAVVRLNSCELFLASVRPDNDMLRDVYSSFAAGKTVPLEFESYAYQSIAMESTSIARNNVIPNSFKRPLSVSILMQLDSQMSTFTGDKLAGSLFGLTTHRLQVDQRPFPESGYEGAGLGYMHEYQTFLQLGGKHNNDVYGSFVDFDKWRNVYPLICYDIRCLRDEMAGSRTHPPNLQWKATHTAPTAAATAHVIIAGKEVRHLNMLNNVLTVSSPDFID